MKTILDPRLETEIQKLAKKFHPVLFFEGKNVIVAITQKSFQQSQLKGEKMVEFMLLVWFMSMLFAVIDSIGRDL